MSRRLAVTVSLALSLMVTAAVVALGTGAGWFNPRPSKTEADNVLAFVDDVEPDVEITAKAHRDDVANVAAVPPATEDPTPEPTVIIDYVYRDVIVRRAAPPPQPVAPIATEPAPSPTPTIHPPFIATLTPTPTLTAANTPAPRPTSTSLPR